MIISHKRHIYTLTDLPQNDVHVMIRTKLMNWSLNGYDAQEKYVRHELVEESENGKFRLYKFVGPRVVHSIVIDVTRNSEKPYEKTALSLGISSSRNDWDLGMNKRKRDSLEEAGENSGGRAKRNP